MQPTVITESDSLRAFLAYLNPEFKLPSRRKLGDDIKTMGNKVKNEIVQLVSKQDYLATTADSWSSHHRAFVGSTVSWLDKDTLDRKTAVLGIKEVKESQTGQFLAKSLCQLNEDFNISSKVLSTTTDNGSNYVSAFVHYGKDHENLVEPGAVVEDNPDVELAEHPRIISVEEALGQAHTDEALQAEISLPEHQRCAAHTINLLASEDVSQVKQWNHGPRNPFRRAAAKAQALWNAQGRRSIVANQIKEAIGKKFKTPGATRWNSSYDSYKQLSQVLDNPESRRKINCIMSKVRPAPIPPFLDEDIAVIKEYVKVMAPVSQALDKMQSDQQGYMGNYLPNLMVLERELTKLSSDNTIKYAQNLVTTLLKAPDHHGRGKKGFTERFRPMFTDMNKLMATAFHPRFRLKTVKVSLNRTNPELYTQVRNRMVSDLVALIRSTEEDRRNVDYRFQSQPTYSRLQSTTGNTEQPFNDEFDFIY